MRIYLLDLFESLPLLPRSRSELWLRLFESRDESLEESLEDDEEGLLAEEPEVEEDALEELLLESPPLFESLLGFLSDEDDEELGLFLSLKYRFYKCGNVCGAGERAGGGKLRS